MFKIQCHCGNICLTAEQAPVSLTDCNCSICRRLGALWAYYEIEQVQIMVLKHPPISYQRDSGEIEFYHCSVCGCTTHYLTSNQSGAKKIVLNARMAASEVIDPIKVRYFDGAKSWTFFDDPET